MHGAAIRCCAAIRRPTATDVATTGSNANVCMRVIKKVVRRANPRKGQPPRTGFIVCRDPLFLGNMTAIRYFLAKHGI